MANVPRGTFDGVEPFPSEHRPWATLRPRRFLFLPWKMLVSDNRRFVKRGYGLTTEYRHAKAAAQMMAALEFRGQPPLAGRLRITGTIVAPTRRRYDITNYCKLVLDCLTGSAYQDDSQLDEVVWRRGSVNADAAGLTLLVEEL